MESTLQMVCEPHVGSLSSLGGDGQLCLLRILWITTGPEAGYSTSPAGPSSGSVRSSRHGLLCITSTNRALTDHCVSVCCATKPDKVRSTLYENRRSLRGVCVLTLTHTTTATYENFLVSVVRNAECKVEHVIGTRVSSSYPVSEVTAL